ncbi:putative nuclease HARBI1 isoform X2 [Leptopilina boulardi]|uniref:putative nuclease HARBI1 isoform X2 n=1 Tax=Leptopilina boulardi TaxID=63433 RepID=UPI0021F67DA2|nr:putative nuclease HARBI1 isoform X2 [Leptopilina boulardi]
MTVYLLLFIATLLYSFLAHGDSVSTTKQFFRIGRSTTYAIIAEVCPLIWTVLQPLVLKRKTQRELRVIAGGFRAKWDFPNCVGVVDGKEINIKAPPHSGSYYFNYKKFFSIKLLAACDAYYRFIWVDIGNYGSVSDAAAFKRTRLYEALERDEADFPARGRLPRSNFVLPHYLIEDEIFSQQTYMMVPFARRRGLTERQTHFNYNCQGPAS